MPKASELKKGMIVEIDGAPHIVKQLEAKSPSSRGAATLYKVRFNNLQTRQKLDSSFKGDDLLKEADCVRVPVQFSYVDGDEYYFMNQEDYSQYAMNTGEIEDQIPYLVEQQEGIIALIMDGNLVGDGGNPFACNGTAPDHRIPACRRDEYCRCYLTLR